MRYEREGKAIRTVPAQQLWHAIVESEIETGGPYMLYKDSCNRKSNQQNLGTIQGSNLCTEVIQYSSPDEVAVCNLASVSLKEFVVRSEQSSSYYNHELLHDAIAVMVRNLNQVIDRTHYPIEEARRSNMRHRPIGLGVQGLADTFFLMRFPFESKEAAQLNEDIFETIYHAACQTSMELSMLHGPYETFKGKCIDCIH